MNYSDLSDFEINKRVAEALDLDWSHVDFDVDSSDPKICIDTYDAFDKSHTGIIVDYCNNPSDAWPVIVENKISIMHGWVGEGWAAADSVTVVAECIEYKNDNPLRAAMIVFLMMRDKS